MQSVDSTFTIRHGGQDLVKTLIKEEECSFSCKKIQLSSPCENNKIPTTQSLPLNTSKVPYDDLTAKEIKKVNVCKYLDRTEWYRKKIADLLNNNRILVHSATNAKYYFLGKGVPGDLKVGSESLDLFKLKIDSLFKSIPQQDTRRGLRSVSCTLATPAHTFTGPTGLLFDADQSTIRAMSQTDLLSCDIREDGLKIHSFGADPAARGYSGRYARSGKAFLKQYKEQGIKTEFEIGSDYNNERGVEQGLWGMKSYKKAPLSSVAAGYFDEEKQYYLPGTKDGVACVKKTIPPSLDEFARNDPIDDCSWNEMIASLFPEGLVGIYYKKIYQFQNFRPAALELKQYIMDKYSVTLPLICFTPPEYSYSGQLIEESKFHLGTIEL